MVGLWKSSAQDQEHASKKASSFTRNRQKQKGCNQKSEHNGRSDRDKNKGWGRKKRACKPQATKARRPDKAFTPKPTMDLEQGLKHTPQPPKVSEKGLFF